MLRTGTLWYSTLPPESDNDERSNDNVNDEPRTEELDDEFNDFLGGKPELELQGVDPKRGWGFRGVHKVFDGIN